MAVKEKSNKKVLLWGLIVLVAISAAGVAYIQLTQKPARPYRVPEPVDVVSQYFMAWNARDWPNMYATISDGFKKIDPDAKDLATFGDFAGSQGIEGVSIISIKEISNDGTTASVEYSVEFILSDDSKRQFSDTFTLKFKQGDIIPGWKLIHPYGSNVDAS